MAYETVVVVVVALIFGLGVGSFLSKTKLADKVMKDEKSKILNDPELLIKKLNENGKIIDEGKELKYSVVDGKVKLDKVAEKIAEKIVKKVSRGTRKGSKKSSGKK